MSDLNHSELLDDAWRWVSANMDQSNSTTGTVHLVDCALILNRRDATLRPVRPKDIVTQRCLECEKRSAESFAVKREAKRQADLLQTARENDPGLSDRVRQRREAKLRGE